MIGGTRLDACLCYVTVCREPITKLYTLSCSKTGWTTVTQLDLPPGCSSISLGMQPDCLHQGQHVFPAERPGSAGMSRVRTASSLVGMSSWRVITSWSTSSWSISSALSIASTAHGMRLALAVTMPMVVPCVSYAHAREIPKLSVRSHAKDAKGRGRHLPEVYAKGSA